MKKTLIVLAVLALAVVGFWLWRRGPGASEPPAYRRAAALGRAVAEAYDAAAAERPQAGAEELRTLALSRASGRSEAEIGLMRTLKSALDPKGILNPGKVFDGA